MKIRLGTYNLFQFVEPPYSLYIKKDKFNKFQWTEKSQWIKNQIIEMNCDVIGFQEVFSRNTLSMLTIPQQQRTLPNNPPLANSCKI